MMQLYFDGWYSDKKLARAVLKGCEKMGARPVGIVESKHRTYGIVYWSGRVLFENHVLDGRNAAAAVLRGHPTRLAELAC